MTNADLTGRALAGWYRSGGTGPANARVGEFEGRRYVVVERDGVILAVYRVRYDGRLRRMRRPPAEITEG